MKGIFYNIGVGPGDPELMTKKAIRILASCPYVAYPKPHNMEKSTAYEIAKDFINPDAKTVEVSFPMKRDMALRRAGRIAAAKQMAEILDSGMDVAFLTLGDATLYSTGMHVRDILVRMGYTCEIVPGVPSFCAAAARLGMSLADEDESVAVVAADRDIEELKKAVDLFDNLVLMKAAPHMEEICGLLKEKGYKAGAVSRCTMVGEKVYEDMNRLQDEQYSYFTTLIAKKEKDG